MFHFPSSLSSSNPSSSGLPRRTDGLNATQQKSSSNPYFLAVEEELHDARRVHAHGQEEDLRFALNMVISRVTELARPFLQKLRNDVLTTVFADIIVGRGV